jgi:hypothetical protein
VSACGGMMLTFGQMMLRAGTQMMLVSTSSLCELRTQMKKSIAIAMDFLRCVDKKDANEMFGNQQDLKLYIGFIIS